MRTAKDYETTINFSGEVIETRYIHSAKDVLDRNLEVTEAFLHSVQAEYAIHKNDPNLAIKHPQFLSVRKELILDYLNSFSAHNMNSDFVIHELVRMFADDKEGVFDNWDIVIAQGSESACTFAGIEDILPVKRGFAYRKDTKSLQMSGKNSRLGSKDLAKGGLTRKEVERMEALVDNGGKAFSENFYFKTGIKRNPLMVIYPVKLSCKAKGEDDNSTKQKIVETINYPVVGLSIGIPLVTGKLRQHIKYKINKQKWMEIYGADDDIDFDEIDETIPED